MEYKRNLRLGVEGYTDDELSLNVYGNVNVSGNISVAGTVTYDDVTNVDAIGLVTARSGIDIGYPGTATTLTADGNAVFSGIVTAAQFFGDGSGLDGVTGVNIVAQEVTGDPVYPTFASNVGVTTLGIAQTGFVYVPSTGSVGIGTTNPNATLVVTAPSGYSGDILNIQDTDYTYGTRFRVTAGVSSVYLVTDGFNSSTLSSQGYWFSSSRFGSGTQRHGMGTRYSSASAGIAFWALGNAIAGAANNGFFVDGTYGLGFAGGSVASVNPDTFIIRDAANNLAQRNGTNPNTFRIYNTYTSATNFERANVGWTTNTFIVGTEKGSAGGTARQLELQTDGTTRVAITTDGYVGIGTTQPDATLVVNAPSGYTGTLFNLKEGASSWLQLYRNSSNSFYVDFRNTGQSEKLFRVGDQNSFSISSSGITIAPDRSLGFSSIFGLSATTRLYQDAANNLAQRNGTNPNTFRIYNTYTSATNFERGQVGWSTDVFIVGTEKGSAGGSPRQLELQTDGTTRVAITTDGYVGIGTTNPNATLVVNAPSGYTGNLLDLQVGGSSKLKFNELGYGVNGSYRWGVQNTQGSTTDFLFFIKWNTHNYPGCAFGDISATPTFAVDSRGIFGWANSNSQSGQGVKNLAEIGTRLYRDATGIIGQRNGSTPNTFRVYNTYTSATNFERGQVGWSTDVFIVGTEKGSAGGSPRQLELQTDGTTRVAITTDGYVGMGTTQPTEALEVAGNVKATKYYGEPEISPVMMSMLF